MASTPPRIVLTGLACNHPMGKSLAECSRRLGKADPQSVFTGLDDRASGRTPVGRLASDGARLDLTPMERRAFDRITTLVCDTVRQCIDDAGLAGRHGRLAATGIISGSAFGCLRSQDRLRQVLKEKGPAFFDPIEFPLTSHNFPISAAAIKFGLKGPITAMVASMSAGLNALIYAAFQIMKGQAPRMMVIAFDEINALQYAFLDEKRCLQGAVRPAPDQATRPVHPSESCVAWLLESERAARERQADVYARLGDWCIGAGRFRGVDVDAMRRGIVSVLESGAADPAEQVVFVANGSGIAAEDDAEDQVLDDLARDGVRFRDQIRLKPAIGNCLGAAGLMEGALLLYRAHYHEWCQGDADTPATPAFLMNSFGMGGNMIALLAQSVPAADARHGSRAGRGR